MEEIYYYTLEMLYGVKKQSMDFLVIPSAHLACFDINKRDASSSLTRMLVWLDLAFAPLPVTVRRACFGWLLVLNR